MKAGITFTAVLAFSTIFGMATWAQSVQAPATPPARTTDIPQEVLPAPSATRTIPVENLTARELRDKPVYDRSNEKIATVKDVTGTPGQGHLRQVILHTGGMLGIGGNEVILPLEKLSVAADGRLRVSMTEDELKLLPKVN